MQLTFDEVGGQLQCREVRIASSSEGREVRRADLRGISIDDAREEVAAARARTPTIREGGPDCRVMEWDPDSNDPAARHAGVREVRRSRRTLNEETLRKVLEVYPGQRVRRTDPGGRRGVWRRSPNSFPVCQDGQGR